LEAEGILADIRLLDQEQEPIYQMLSGQAWADGTLLRSPVVKAFISSEIGGFRR